ncbi:PREDICTED: nuclear transcription factor Y subunit B-3-like [Nicotiana attenuata]|uniref:Nuclear transcription factor y subunit b-3 n=1 Tax=Nicotiana attenuata TaxID=49451 RepID=A0A314KKA1_NICAT|nr:PREDICTED: nuclear transcription factor Y subunit B-3-like [Nicotiana attenuata]OIT29693.1 nuclear transcription factor y subunit b-3 [Nicotiana attenuata]
MTGKRSQNSPVGSPLSGDNSSKELDKFLPIANVSRIMKKSLPANAKISKEAKETVQECVSEFISFITGEASDKCQREKRKTINGDDLLWAMTTLGFENYVGPLKGYLNKYRETEGEKNIMARNEEPFEPTNDNYIITSSNSTTSYNNNIGVHGHGHDHVTKFAKRPEFIQSFNNGNLAQSFGDYGRVNVYGENLTSAANLHGVEW